MLAEPSRIKEELESKFGRGQVKKREGKYEYVEIRPVVQRLNDVLGYDGWSFVIIREMETDKTLIVCGELTIHADGCPVRKMQYGRKNIVLKKNTDIPLDIGNDWKAAASDCLKKCATLVGVGLYLSENEYQDGSDGSAGSRRQAGNNPPPPPPQEESSPESNTEPGSASDEVLDMRKQVHKLEAKVLAMHGGTRTEMRTKLLNSINLPLNMNGLLDYQTKLEDSLSEGKDA